MDTIALKNDIEARTLWHVMVDLAYEGTDGESNQDGVEKIRKALNPLVENGSGIKHIIFLRLPETDRINN